MALVVHAVLITLGGLGFVVLATVWQPPRAARGRQPVPVQVRTVLVTSGVLVVVRHAALRRLRVEPHPGRPADARQGGQRALPERDAAHRRLQHGRLHRPAAAATALFMILFMFVGASPGSTGGGIKTTTATVLLAAIRSATTARRAGAACSGARCRGRSSAQPGDPGDLGRRGRSAGFFLLLLFEHQPFLDLFFETVSAFGTVGLSLGATATPRADRQVDHHRGHVRRPDRPADRSPCCSAPAPSGGCCAATRKPASWWDRRGDVRVRGHRDGTLRARGRPQPGARGPVGALPSTGTPGAWRGGRGGGRDAARGHHRRGGDDGAPARPHERASSSPSARAPPRRRC